MIGPISNLLDFKVKLQGILTCLDCVGEDGGLLLHPDGSAHIIDGEGEECIFLPDMLDDLDGAFEEIEYWSYSYGEVDDEVA